MSADTQSERATAQWREPHGARVWFGVVGGIGAWMTHLTAEAALARYVCITGREWLLHLLTVALAGVTVAAMIVAAGLAPSDSAGPSPERRDLVFLSRLGLLIGAINLVLIIGEGALPIWVPACG